MRSLPESAHVDGAAIARAYDSQGEPTIRRWIVRFTSRSPLFGCWYETEGTQIAVEHDIETYLGRGGYNLTEWTPELAAECAALRLVEWQEAINVSRVSASRVHRRVSRGRVADVGGVAVSDAADALGSGEIHGKARRRKRAVGAKA